MDLMTPPPQIVPYGLRAMNTVGTVDGGLKPAARAVIAAAQRLILKSDIDIDELDPITPEELASHVTVPALARQLVTGMTVVSLADGPPRAATVAQVERFARALGVDEPWLKAIHRLAEQQMLVFRLDFMRRSHIAALLRNTYQDKGTIGLIKEVLGLRGVYEDPELARRYQALGELAPDTLGRAFFDHYREHGFAFPGEAHGFPEAGVYHDFAHVLGGYSTEPRGEMGVGGFQAGFRKENPVFMALFVVLTFSTGVNMTPLPQPHVEALLAEPGVAEDFLDGIRRGAAMNTDLSDRWDFWPLVALPLDEARAQLGVPPRG